MKDCRLFYEGMVDGTCTYAGVQYIHEFAGVQYIHEFSCTKVKKRIYDGVTKHFMTNVMS